MTKSTKLGLGILGGFCALVAGYYVFVREPVAPETGASVLDTLHGPNASARGPAPVTLPLSGSSLTVDSTPSGNAVGSTLATAIAASERTNFSLESRASTTPADSAAPRTDAPAPAPGAIAMVANPLPAAPSGIAPATASPNPSIPAQLRTPAPTAPATTVMRTHTVKEGETLSDIAKAAYGRSSAWTEIVKVNPLVDPNKLQIGQVIKLPDLGAATPRVTTTASPTTQPTQPNFGSNTIRSTSAVANNGLSTTAGGTIYTVQEGDTLWSIAQKHYKDGNKWEAIYAANRRLLSNPDQVRFGMKLTVPAEPK